MLYFQSEEMCAEGRAWDRLREATRLYICITTQRPAARYRFYENVCADEQKGAGLKGSGKGQ
jgi:uncharacterized protein (DUF736 family)